MRFLLQAVQGWSIKHGVKSYGELLFLKMQHQLWCARFLILGRTSCWCKQILIWIQHKYILNRSKKFWKRLCLTRRLCLGSRYVGTITMLTELCWLFLFLFRWVMCWLQDHVSLFDTIMSSVSDNFLNLFLVKCSIWWRFLPNYMNHTLVLNITDFRDIWDFLFKIWLLVTCVAMGTCMYLFSRKKKPWLP